LTQINRLFAKEDPLRMANAERRFALAEMACAGDLKRLGIRPTGGKLNPDELDRTLTERKVEPGERIRIKSALAGIGWLD
jgi:hypothetical protein